MKGRELVGFSWNPGVVLRKDWDGYYVFNPRDMRARVLNESVTYVRVARWIYEAISTRDVKAIAKLRDDQLSLLVAKGVIVAPESPLGAASYEYKDESTGGEEAFYSPLFPIMALMELHLRCNLQCGYCFPDASRRMAVVPELSIEDLTTITKRLVEAQVIRVTLTGGEPLLRFDALVAIASIFRDHNIWTAFITNGLLLNESRADRMKDLGVWTAVSLDAADEETNAKTRGCGVWAQAVAAIRLLQKKETLSNVIATVTRDNFETLPELLAFLSSLGVKTLILQDLKPSTSNPSVYQRYRLTSEQEKRVPDMLAECASKSPEVRLSANELNIFSRALLNAQEEGGQSRGLMRCRAGQASLYIDSSGDVFPCTSLTSLRMGNALKESIVEMWQTSEAMQFLRRLRAQSTDVLEGCDSSCSAWSQCDGGCRGEAFDLTGSWQSLHPRCLKMLDKQAACVGVRK